MIVSDAVPRIWGRFDQKRERDAEINGFWYRHADETLPHAIVTPTLSFGFGVSLLNERQIQRVESSYDTTHVEVGVIVPPTQKQFDALLARPEVWSAEIDGAEPRDNDAVLAPEREARLEKKRRAGAICPTVYIRATTAPHVSQATIRSWMEQIPTAAPPSIRKPANDVRVTPSTSAEADAVHALGPV